MTNLRLPPDYESALFGMPDEGPSNSPIQQRIIDSVQNYVGCSLHNREQELRTLIARGVDDPRQIIYPGRSTCGLFVLAIWHAVGIKHELLSKPYQTGMAITWVLRIAHDLNAVRYPRRDGPPVPGAVMHYYLKGKNDDHVEFCLTNPEVSTMHGRKPPEWVASHAGGGRADCAVGEGQHENVLWNSSRPLQAWIDPNALVEEPGDHL